MIVVARGFIAKSILRSGVLDELKKSGQRIVILFWSASGQAVPEKIRREFESAKVIVDIIPSPNSSRGYRWFKRLTVFLVYNYRNQKFRQLVSDRSSIRFRLRQIFSAILSRPLWLKRLARWVEETIFTDDSYVDYFAKYRPNVVFSTSIISSVDIALLKSARKQNIPTVAMPRGWDNINARFYQILPDWLVVHNEQMKRDAVAIQGMRPERVMVTGFPQFDWYRRPEILQSREEFFRARGLDPAKKLILWGSSGRLTQSGTSICDFLAETAESGRFVLPIQLLIRAHFSDVKSGRFDYLKERTGVAIDHNITRSNFFYDGADPSVAELVGLANTLYHADLIIVQSSTLSLDALCFDKPVINTAYQGLYDKQGRDITEVLYDEDCYRPLVDLNAVELVHNESELLKSINAYLENPDRHHSGRMKALERLCYRADGQSSKRIADVILSSL